MMTDSAKKTHSRCKQVKAIVQTPVASIEDKANEVQALITDPDVLDCFRQRDTAFYTLLRDPMRASEIRSLLDLPPRFRLREYEQWHAKHNAPMESLTEGQRKERIRRAKWHEADKMALYLFSSINRPELVEMGAFVILTILRDRQLDGPCMIRIAKDWLVGDADINRTWSSMEKNWAAWRPVIDEALRIVRYHLREIGLLPRVAVERQQDGNGETTPDKKTEPAERSEQPAPPDSGHQDEPKSVVVDRLNTIELPRLCKPASSQALATFFGVSPSTIRRRIKNHILHGEKDGRKWRIPLKEMPAEAIQKAIQK